jgi:hypothetical protein
MRCSADAARGHGARGAASSRRPARPVLRIAASAARRARGVVRNQARGCGTRNRGPRPAARLATGVPMPRHDVRVARARPVPRRSSRTVRPRRRSLRGGRQRSPDVAACVPTRCAPGATACVTLCSMSRRGSWRGSPTWQPRLSLCVVPAQGQPSSSWETRPHQHHHAQSLYASSLSHAEVRTLSTRRRLPMRVVRCRLAGVFAPRVIAACSCVLQQVVRASLSYCSCHSRVSRALFRVCRAHCHASFTSVVHTHY